VDDVAGNAALELGVGDVFDEGEHDSACLAHGVEGLSMLCLMLCGGDVWIKVRYGGTGLDRGRSYNA
jgi:hypothetical protein